MDNNEQKVETTTSSLHVGNTVLAAVLFDEKLKYWRDELYSWRRCNVKTGHIPECKERFELATEPMVKIIADLEKLKKHCC